MTAHSMHRNAIPKQSAPPSPPPPSVPSLSPEVRDNLRHYADLGGFTLRAESHPWYAAVDFVGSLEEARAASTVLAELRGRDLPVLRDVAQRLGAILDTDATGTAGEAARIVGLFVRVRGTLETLRPEAYESELDALVAATASGVWRAERGVRQSWLRRRALGRQARRLAATRRTRREALNSALESAAVEREEWAALARAGGRPVLPTEHAFLDDAGRVAEAVMTGLRELGRLLRPEDDLATLPLKELTDRLDGLAADEGTLYRLPRLRALRDGLRAQDLGELLAELTARRAGTAEVDALAAPTVTPPAEAANAEPEAATGLVPDPAPEPEGVATVSSDTPTEEPALDAGTAANAGSEDAASEAEAPAESETEAAIETAPEPAPAPEPALAVEPAPSVEPELHTPEPEAAASPTPEPAAEPATAKPASRPARRPRKPAIMPGRPVTAYTADELNALVRWIDSDRVERTDDQLLRAAMKELGFTRLGPRIKEALGTAITAVRG